uniref:Hexosyltransferase n=1 Tax=Sphaeramia orbicularis TaxID=375764 RepID=A0A673BC89_9TELE
YLDPMRRIQTFIAMVLLIPVVDVGSSKQENITLPHPDVFRVSVSESLTQTIPQNGAYWNRLLYSALKNVDNESRSKHEPPWPQCRETSQEPLKTNIHDFNSYPALFQDFLQGMNCRFPPVLIDQPNKCTSSDAKGDSKTFLLFAIKSRPAHFEQRQAVRDTWGQEGLYQNNLRVRTVFLLGSSLPDDPDLTSLLSFEAKTFGDVLQWDFHDSFLNLTLKMNMLLQWTLKNCPHVSFMFSGDDDVFVNTPALLSYLQSHEPSKASQLYVGQVINTASPLRNPSSKYYIPLSFYDGPYPAYVGGGGFVFSGVLLQKLYGISHAIPFFPIDDVYNGMCFKALGISPEPHAGFQTFDVNEQDRENLCVHKSIILVHQRSPQQMKKLWKGIHSPFLTC